MVYFLWLVGALIILGLFWLKKKNTKTPVHNVEWPTPTWSKSALEDKLLLADPWEVATWLTVTFSSKDEIWPELKEILAKSGLEGMLLGAVASGGEHQVLGVKALGLVGSQVCLPVLVKALGSKDDELSLEAMDAIKKLSLPESGNLLIDALITGKGALPSRCAHILISLGNLVKDSILKALPQVPDEFKPVLIEVLGEMKQEEILPSLAPYLKSSHSLIRQKAVQACGTIGSPMACNLLLPLLTDEDWRVKADAAKFLGELGCLEAVDELKRLCNDSTWHVQVNAREALEELGVTLEN